VQTAIARLRETGADSVVSVVELPKTHHPEFQCQILDGQLVGLSTGTPTRRQDVDPTFIRDGTVYAFWRRTAARGTLYGETVIPLIIPASETCELDTLADWEALEARLARV
jgi:CMP-N-acetylneuraminic acid synthetase